MGYYIQQPIDIGICGVNLRPSTSSILDELFFAEGVPKAIENVEKYHQFVVCQLCCSSIGVI